MSEKDFASQFTESEIEQMLCTVIETCHIIRSIKEEIKASGRWEEYQEELRKANIISDEE